MKLLFKPFLLSLLLASFSQAQTLTVYTYQSFTSEWGPGPQIETLFEAQCDCDVEFIGLEDGVSLLNRLRLEGQQTSADIVLGLDDALIEETKALNLLQAHGMTFENLDLPYAFNDDQFVPYDYGHFAFIYDDQKVTDVPSSLKELVEDSELSIIYQDPRTSTPGQGLMLWVKAVYGDESAQAWQQLKEKTVTVTPGWSEAYSLFLEGKSDLVLSYVTSPAYHMTWDETEQYKAAEFSEGHYVQIEMAAALKTSKEPELAKSFLQFLISTEAQAVLASTNWMQPVLKDAETPAAFDKLITPKTIYTPSSTVYKNRKQWLREWRSSAS
ncbi:thiamine ABC transporter substrate binding subunit [Reinekea thalattae]|uniref:Thiamine-binding periplasmic protein n=1 Tax=Reinekea thalattae TaxID=2593301 RepID=A0A5C8Z4Q5_9GAMM|nr:thiamine ABC transporter substrate binding subunit [Reinekea thalattae]TXR53002.1 thiamine ABC transporter substrate binding subunit [Reinekea thalattae]